MAHERVRQASLHILALLVAGSCSVLANGCANSGGLPSWVKNPYAEFPKDRYVVAVGTGRSLDAAKRDALNGIATFLGVEITASVGVEQGETVIAENGRRNSRQQMRADESVNQIISQKLSSVVIERAHSDGPTTYVLALLDKPTFLAGLASEVENAARMLSEGMKIAAAADSPPRSLLFNLQAIAQRLQAMDGHIIALGGKISPDVTVILRNSLGFLARFDISLPSSPPPGAARTALVCDQADPRFKKAIADSEALLGHSLEIRLNLEQLPKGRDFCDDLFESYIGLIPKDIAQIKQFGAALFEYGARALKIIDLDYDGTASRSEIDFDRAKGTLRIVMAGRGGDPIPSRAVSYALGKEYEAWLIAHFSGVEPEKVAAAEYALYLDFLENYAWQGRDTALAKRPRRDAFADNPSYEAVVKMVRLAGLAAHKDAKVAEAARDWLAALHDDFGRTYLHNPGLVAKAPGDSAFKRAERVWIDWLNAAFDGFSDEMKLRVLPDVMQFSVPFNNDEGIVWNELAYPGLKTYEMGLAIIDRWCKAGHPGASFRADPGDKRLALFLAIANPVRRDRKALWDVEYMVRGKNWYFHALRSEALRKRLLAEMLARKDDMFTETVFANISRYSSPPGTGGKNEQRNGWADFLFFWRGLEADPKQWNSATRLVAESGMISDELYDEAVKLWRRYPWTHGRLLYLLAMMTRARRSMVPWSEFGRVFGGAVSAKEAGEFLNLGCHAMEVLPELWPALGKGWPRFEILAPQLDGYIEEAHACANDHQAPYSTFTEIARRLREEKATGDLSKLHAYFKKRIAEHPSQERDFQELIELTH